MWNESHTENAENEATQTKIFTYQKSNKNASFLSFVRIQNMAFRVNCAQQRIEFGSVSLFLSVGFGLFGRKTNVLKRVIPREREFPNIGETETERSKSLPNEIV